MRADLVLAGGEVATPAGLIPADVLVRDGAITGVVEQGTGRGAERLDATGRWILPGMVDLHVHLRDPGHPEKETFATGTAAAAHGGVTTVGDMPNTVPPLLTEADLVDRIARAGEQARVDFTFWAGAARPEEFPGFARQGAAGVKVFLAGREQGGQYASELSITDDGHLLEILDAARAAGLPVAVHLSNPAIERVWRRGWAGRGIAELREEVVGESRLDKVEAGARVLLLAEHTGAHVHLVHVSSAVLPLVRRARRRGVRVTAETFAPFMSTADIDRHGVQGYDRYRRPAEIAELWAGLEEGTIDTLASDHAPHIWAEKEAGETDLLACSSGYPELDTILPMMLDRVLHGELDLGLLVTVFAARPARLAGLGARKGDVMVGRDADLVVIDPDGEWVVDAAECRSAAGWTPFAGTRLRGRIDRVLLRGQDVDQGPARGAYRPRETTTDIATLRRDQAP